MLGTDSNIIQEVFLSWFVSLKTTKSIHLLAVFEDEIRNVKQPLSFASNFKALYDVYHQDENVFEGVRQIDLERKLWNHSGRGFLIDAKDEDF